FVNDRPEYFATKQGSTLTDDQYKTLYSQVKSKNNYEFTNTFREQLLETRNKELQQQIKIDVEKDPVLKGLGTPKDDFILSTQRQYAPLQTTGTTPAKVRPLTLEVKTDTGGNYIQENGNKFYLQKDANGKTKDTGTLLDEQQQDTKIPYEIAKNDKIIYEKMLSEHKAAATLIKDGRNKGRVEKVSAGPTLYLENTYNDAGIVTGTKVYERTLANDNLGTSEARYVGTLQEARQIYQEQGKTSHEAKAKLQNIEEANNCVGLINKNTAGKDLKTGETVRTGCKLGNYAVQQASKEFGSRCTDFMSPNNCKLLFNACDPVICPSSRCNLGGKWQVDNVVQTGIIGSVALCAPNWALFGGDIYTLPVCLTGIIAGLENIHSILESYKQCLITAKVEGRSVGFCDMLRNFYLCDTLWREAAAIFSINNGLLGAIGEQVFSSNGGGEYASFKANFERSTKELDYFTKDYAKQVFAGYA
ncbi:MAG: hypothetical protein Q7R56_00945, partial [Nanoarchaeota archaeon]|nr:hypothetical protein [Nanoarchaeota archaeon]